jgi:hypothetical protein
MGSKSGRKIVETQSNILISAEVVDFTQLDGCGFLLQLNDSTKLIPLNFPDSLKKNNLRIKIKYHTVNKNTICMAGKTVELILVKYNK